MLLVNGCTLFLLGRIGLTGLFLSSVITIPGIWKNPGAVYPIFRDIQIPGLFDDLVITNSGILKNQGMYFMLIFGMNKKKKKLNI